METPSHPGSGEYQESNTTNGALLIPIIYFNNKLKDAHDRFGIRYEYELIRSGDHQLAAVWKASSPYLAALQRIYAGEASGELEAGSSFHASSAIFNGTFDETAWATYLPGTPPAEY